MPTGDPRDYAYSPCCHANLISGAGCPMCKTCSQCRRFLGCYNRVGDVYRDFEIINNSYYLQFGCQHPSYIVQEDEYLTFPQGSD